MSLDKETIDIRENKNCITSVLRERVRKIRDYIITRASEWFDRIDSEGWVLRPILYKKNTDEQIKILSIAFKKMLIHDLDFEELGSKKDQRLSEGEYTELNIALKNVLIGKIYEGQGYKETGLFIKEDDNNFGIAIPHCVNKIIKFNANSNKAMGEYENKFFFSVAKDVKAKKIIEQWILFMISLNLLNKTQDGFIGRTSSYDLNGRYDLVKKWLDDDCKKEIESMKNVINGPYLNVIEEIQIPFYKGRLQVAESIKDSIKIELLEDIDKDTCKNFKDIISNIEEFTKICYQVYDKEMWNHIKSYSPNIIKDIEIQDKNKPLWFRIRHIRLFIDYINNLKIPAENSILKKITEIKNSCIYEGSMLPISPITNILKQYCNELQNSTDYEKMTLSKTETMVVYVDTLAFKLKEGNFSGAANRIEYILDQCGLEQVDNSELKWANDSGIIGEYKNIYKNFKFIVDGYKKKGESEKWIQYFSDAPESLKNHPEVKNLNRCIKEIDLFINGGFEQEIEDSEYDMLGKPEQFIDLLKKRIDEMYQTVGVVDGYKNNVMNLAKSKKNDLRDEVLITTIDKIRNLEGKAPASIELRMEDYPKEKIYEETKKVMENKMNELTNEGETFFKTSSKVKKVTFSFYKDVVDKNGEIDWDNYSEEMKELIDVKLIRYKIEV